jgi:riboflavin kinase/FMN adenylyltransferase
LKDVMRILRRARGFAGIAADTVLLAGDFDGFHLGHQDLVRMARAEALRTHRRLVAIDLSPSTGARPITPFRSAMSLMAQAGIDIALPPLAVEDYSLAEVCAARPHAAFVWGRPADVESAPRLRQMVEAWDSAGISVRCFGEPHGLPAAAAIRAALAGQRPAEAAQRLGRCWSVEAHVEHGDARGRTIGFPTANMRLQDCLWPAFGTYAVRVAIPHAHGARWHGGVANFGIRPTYQTPEPRLETYIFDFDGDLYDRRIIVAFMEWLRPERKFPSLEMLIGQLTDDAAQARAILRAAPEELTVSC